MTDREDNDTSVQPQTQAMGTAAGDPRGGEIPMRRNAAPFDVFPCWGILRINTNILETIDYGSRVIILCCR